MNETKKPNQEPVEDTEPIRPYQTAALIGAPPASPAGPPHLRGSLPAALGLQPDLFATRPIGSGATTRLMPPRQSGVAPANSAVASTNKPLADANIAGVVVKVIPGSVAKVGDPFYYTRATLGNGTSRKRNAVG
jgi:hypothetical protein